jgi:hypothetical protein
MLMLMIMILILLMILCATMFSKKIRSKIMSMSRNGNHGC